MTETPQVQRFRKSIGSQVRPTAPVAHLRRPTSAPPHTPSAVLFFSCYSCLLFLSCLLFFSCYSFFSFLVILAFEIGLAIFMRGLCSHWDCEGREVGAPREEMQCSWSRMEVPLLALLLLRSRRIALGGQLSILGRFNCTSCPRDCNAWVA